MEKTKASALHRLTAILLAVLLAMGLSAAMAEETAVARIGDTEYTTLDDAVAAAEDGATITVLADCSTEKGLNLSKDLTIEGVEGVNPTITFAKYGIALWGKALTFKNCNVVMNGIGSTPYTGEWNWMTVCASKNASLTLDHATMLLDGSNAGNKHAIYFCSNNKLNLNDSVLTIRNYQQDALEWDGGNGGYNVNIVNSTFVSDHNRSGFTGTFYATIDHSTVEVINSTGNGSNGTYFTIKNNSNVLFDGNGNWGISAWRIDMTDKSTLTATNNGYSGIWTRVLNVDKTCTLDVEGNGTKVTGFTTNAGIFFQGNGTYQSTIEAGADVTIKNNTGSGIYTAQSVCNLTLLSGLITNNGTGAVNMSNGKGATYGGGVYNIGTMVLGKGVVLYNNHADTAGDDIYSTKAITFDSVGSGWYLDGDPDCYDLIDGWYDDSEGTRWEAHSVAERHIELYPDVTVSSPLALKAAHGILIEPSYPEPGTMPENELGKEADARLDENYQANVTLSMPSYSEPLETDVVFVLDKSTSVEVENEALNMLSTLQKQLENTGAKINVGVVIFNKVAHVTDFMDLETEYDAIEKAIKQEISSGTNTHAGLLAGVKLLEEDTHVSDSRKYLIFVSDGITYIFDDGNGNATSILTTAYESNAGNVVTSSSDTMDTLYMKYPYYTDFIKDAGGLTAYLTKIGSLIAKDGTTYWGGYGTQYSQTLKSNRNGNTIILNDDVFEGYVGNDSVDNHANNIDTALYLTYQVYQYAAGKYHCYAMKATTTDYSKTYPWSVTFMDELAGGKEVSFADIQNDLCYLYGAGSEVTDVIGFGANEDGIDYAFDFVNDPGSLTLVYGKVDETGTIVEPVGYDIDLDATVTAEDHTTYYFGKAGAKNGEDYAFELTYYPNGIEGLESNAVEHFVLKFNRDIMLGEQVKLTYKVELEEEYQEAEPGLYTGLHTNRSAYIDPVDSEGNDGERQFFPDPTTSYENIRVYKEWQGGGSVPASVQINLRHADGTAESLTLSKEGGWQGDFLNIREDDVVEEASVPANYTSSVSVSSADKAHGYTVTNTYTAPIPTIDETLVTIQKIWDDDGYSGRPAEIKVKLNVEGDPNYVGYTVTLSKDNPNVRIDGNTWTWSKMIGSRNYYAEEISVPGYVSKIEEVQPNYFVITNTYMPSTGDDTPVALYLVLVFSSAVALMGIAVLLHRKSRHA